MKFTKKGQEPFLAAPGFANLSLANSRVVGKVVGPLPHAGADCLPK